MTHQAPHVTNPGFTLIETLIYIALFGVLIAGILFGIEPLFAGVKRMNDRVVAESEAAIVSRTMVSLLTQTQSLTIPAPGVSGHVLDLTTYPLPPANLVFRYRFSIDDDAVVGEVSINGSPLSPKIPLTASRVHFDDIIVTHVPPSGDTPRYVELSYVINGTQYGPMRTYMNF